MNPRACLDDVKASLALMDAHHAAYGLVMYWTWRANGGFEPKDGDAESKMLAVSIVVLIAREDR
jgi:hypothetical protein